MATAPPVDGAVQVRTGVNEVVPDKAVGAPGTGKGCAVTGRDSFDGGDTPSSEPPGSELMAYAMKAQSLQSQYVAH